MKLNPWKSLAGAALAAALLATPAFAALKKGDRAPQFSLEASLAGKAFRFSLKKELKKGPVVLYFFPSAFTKGCDLEAHTFSDDMGEFVKAGAFVLGVSADSLGRLKAFSRDPKYCAGKVPVGSDPRGKVAARYGLKLSPARNGLKDVRGARIDHAFIPRTTFVIARDGRVAAEFSTEADNLSPQEHVLKALEAARALGAGKAE